MWTAGEYPATKHRSYIHFFLNIFSLSVQSFRNLTPFCNNITVLPNAILWNNILFSKSRNKDIDF